MNRRDTQGVALGYLPPRRWRETFYFNDLL